MNDQIYQREKSKGQKIKARSTLSLSLNAEGQNAKSLGLKDPPSEVFGGRRQISV